jgi:hypothetical protein
LVVIISIFSCYWSMLTEIWMDSAVWIRQCRSGGLGQYNLINCSGSQLCILEVRLLFGEWRRIWVGLPRTFHRGLNVSPVHVLSPLPVNSVQTFTIESTLCCPPASDRSAQFIWYMYEMTGVDATSGRTRSITQYRVPLEIALV